MLTLVDSSCRDEPTTVNMAIYLYKFSVYSRKNLTLNSMEIDKLPSIWRTSGRTISLFFTTRGDVDVYKRFMAGPRQMLYPISFPWQQKLFTMIKNTKSV